MSPPGAGLNAAASTAWWLALHGSSCAVSRSWLVLKAVQPDTQLGLAIKVKVPEHSGHGTSSGHPEMDMTAGLSLQAFNYFLSDKSSILTTSGQYSLNRENYQLSAMEVYRGKKPQTNL